jgi:hypothetical protein
VWRKVPTAGTIGLDSLMVDIADKAEAWRRCAFGHVTMNMKGA